MDTLSPVPGGCLLCSVPFVVVWLDESDSQTAGHSLLAVDLLNEGNLKGAANLVP
jgi:hypothetical protein